MWLLSKAFLNLIKALYFDEGLLDYEPFKTMSIRWMGAMILSMAQDPYKMITILKELSCL